MLVSRSWALGTCDVGQCLTFCDMHVGGAFDVIQSVLGNLSVCFCVVEADDCLIIVTQYFLETLTSVSNRWAHR